MICKYKGIVNEVSEQYKDVTPFIDSEITAKYVEQNMGDEKFIKNLINYDSNIALKLFDDVKAMFSSNEKTRVENAWKRAFEEYKANGYQGTVSLDMTYALQDKETNRSLAKNAYDGENLKPVYQQLSELIDDKVNFGLASVDVGDKLNFAGVENTNIFVDYNSIIHSDSEKHPINLKTFSEVLENIPNETVYACDYVNKTSNSLRKAILTEHDGNVYLISLKPDMNINGAIVDKVSSLFKKDDVYNYINESINNGNNYYANEKSNDFLARIALAMSADSSSVAFTYNIANESENVNSSQENTEKSHKQKQLEIIEKFNPRENTLSSSHTWIDSIDDIHTYDEVANPNEDVTTDFKANDVKKALDSGEIRIFSSHPIEPGAWVTPSEMEAYNYVDKSSNNRTFTKKTKLNNIAWVDETQGMYAPVNDTNGVITKDSTGKTLTKDQQKYFANSKAIDDNGNLEKAYHTTDYGSPLFSEFNSVGNSSINRDYYGRNVMFFSNDKAVSKTYANDGSSYSNPLEVTKSNYDELDANRQKTDGYGGYQYGGYLNIEKPCVIEQNGYDWYYTLPNNIEFDKYSRIVKEIDSIDNINEAKETAKYDDMSPLQKTILQGVSEETRKYLVENPPMLIYFANKYKGESGWYGNEFAKNMLDEDVALRMGRKGEVIINETMESNEEYSSNEVVKAVMVINDFYKDVLKQEPIYDGIIFKEMSDAAANIEGPYGAVSDVYAVFNSNQFKLADNYEPTKTQDIRYSLGEKTNNNVDTNSQNETTRLGDELNNQELTLENKFKTSIKKILMCMVHLKMVASLELIE